MTSRASTSKQQQPHLNAPSQVATATITPACCVQCHNIQSEFFCTICLSERIILQHADYRRLREARQRARSRVEALLGLVEIPKRSVQQLDAILPDPFGEPEKKGGSHRRKFSSPITEPHNGASIQDRLARATKFKLQTEIASNTEIADRIQSDVAKGKRRLIERRRDLDRRKSLLKQASEHVKQGGSIDSGDKIDLLSDEKVAALRAKVDELQAEGKQMASEVAKSRAKLVREAFTIFDVCAPSSSLASARNSSTRNKTASPSTRTQRSKERYSAGAFAIDFSSAFDLGRSFREDKAKEEVGNVNDWTILGLVLVLPSDLRRFDRAEINGAISHTIQLLQLVTTYLGITLPFVISVHGSLPQIRANPLWGAGAKETLHLSSSIHSALIATGSSTSGGLGASMMSSLGASTLSTIESFVQLPSAKNLPWAKNVVDPSISKVDATGQTSGAGTEGGPTEDAATLEGKRFCYALTMLSYDVAYLAHLQGVKIDLVMAAGSVLRLLSKAIQSPDLGKRSHIAHHSANNVSNLQFATIDFAQLLQIHEPGSRQQAAASTSKGSSSKAIMEGSYVDAKKAAESILDVRQKDKRPAVVLPRPAISSATPSPRQVQAKTATNTQKKEKLSSLAAKRIPSRLPEESVASRNTAPAVAKVDAARVPPASSNTLDFLRAKGGQKNMTTSDKSKETESEKSKIKAKKTVQVNSSIPASSGTIIFNGKEIRGKTSSKEHKLKQDEEGWHVL